MENQQTIVTWLNSTLQDSPTSIQSLFSGEAACRVWNLLFPQCKIPMHLVARKNVLTTGTNFLLLHSVISRHLLPPYDCPISSHSWLAIVQGHEQSILNLYRWLLELHGEMGSSSSTNAITKPFQLESIYTFSSNGQVVQEVVSDFIAPEKSSIRREEDSETFATPYLPKISTSNSRDILYSDQEEQVLQSLSQLERRLQETKDRTRRRQY